MTDEAAREAARTRFDCPLVVEAGAGTGKTTTLIARLCTWCLGPGWARVCAESPELKDPGDVAAKVLDAIVAITFTEAAAAEMAGRFGEALVAIAGGQPVKGLPDVPVPGPVAAERARHLLAAVDRLAVSTIHAWCSRVLSTSPVQAGLHPQFRVDADGSLLEEVVHEVVVDWFTEVFATEAPQREALLVMADRGVGSEAVAMALTRLATDAVPTAVLDGAAPDAESIAWFVAKTQEVLDRWLYAVEPCLAGAVSRVDKALELLGAVRTMRAGMPAAAPGCLAVLHRAGAAFPDAELATLRNWGCGKFTKTEARLFDRAAARVEKSSDQLRYWLDHVEKIDPELFDAARAVLAPLLGRVEAELGRRGVVTFDQLLRRTRDLLADNPEVRASLRGRLHLLHVDEFQDTDALQCEIVGLLALEGEVRPALFVVGDPKQSIYGWRSADLSAYHEFVERVVAAGGVRLSLDYNRRSVAPVLAEVERVIAPLMLPVVGYQPEFQALRPHRLETVGFPGERAAVEYWPSAVVDPEQGLVSPLAAQATLAEARAIATDLVRLRSAGHKLGEMALLMRSATDLDVYLEAMRDAGVPYLVERDKQYYRRREIVEAAATLRAVLEPTDGLALLTLLRSPAVGVPDAALLPLWRRRLPARMAAVRGEADLDGVEALVAEAAHEAARSGAPGLERVAGWPAAAVAALRAVGWLREHYETLPADRFVAELRARIPAEAVAAGRYLGAFRVANLQRFYADVVEELVAATGDAQRVLRSLRSGIRGRKDAEEARPPDLGGDAVRVMTIHKAKGLEFGHVYVVQMHKERGAHRKDWVENRGEATSAFCRHDAWHLRLFGARSLRYHLVVDHEERIERQERLRLLYVAMTRAKDRLVLLGAWPKPDADSEPAEVTVERAKSLLQLTFGRVGGQPGLAELAEAGGRLEVGDVSWRVPAMRDGPPERLPRATPVDPTPPDLEARLARRAELAAAAALRMARRASAPASDAAHKVLEERLQAVVAETTPPEESVATAPPDPTRAALATAVGTAVHRALEGMDPAASPAEALRSALAAADPPLRAELDEGLLPEGRRRVRALLERFVGGALGAHFRSLRGHLVARELPTLASAPLDGEGPVGFYAGAIDLVHLDPATGEVVVVDFKTDRIVDEAALQARVEAYRLQLDHYVGVVQAGLALAARPRMELWFLALDRRVE